MTYRLTCDRCEFDAGVTEESSAYLQARDHEAANPEHTVFITEL